MEEEEEEEEEVHLHALPGRKDANDVNPLAGRPADLICIPGSSYEIIKSRSVAGDYRRWLIMASFAWHGHLICISFASHWHLIGMGEKEIEIEKRIWEKITAVIKEE